RRVTHHLIVEGDPVRPEDGARLAGDAERGADVVELAEADLLGAKATGLLQPREMDGKQRCARQRRPHLGDLGLGQLERREWASEDLAVVRVGERGLETAAGRAEDAEDDAEAGFVQTGERAA